MVQDKELNWPEIDRWLMGEAWTGSRIVQHVRHLCEVIGPRWASSPAEWQATQYIKAQYEAVGLDQATLEPYEMDTWAWDDGDARLVEEGTKIDMLPFNFCPPVDINAPLVDVGYGTPREVSAAAAQLPGAVAIMALRFEPFTEPIPHPYRLQGLAQAGAAAALVIDRKDGRRVEYHNANDWRDRGPEQHPLPTMATSREHGDLLRRGAAQGQRVRLRVDSRFYKASSANTAGVLEGVDWPDEHLLLGGHHDTVYGAAGGNDNASGVIALMETARVLAGLRAATGQGPGRAIRFVTFSAEEQRFQGSTAYVERHYGPEPPPRLALNLDELSTGPIKGVVLGFEPLRALLQSQFNSMGDGLQCHVMSQIDATSDHFPFLRAGLDAGHLWRWRFAGRHADADYHHEDADTSDKLNVRELKEYVGQLARLLLRLSHVAPKAWPANGVSPDQVQERLEAERHRVIRVF